MAQVADRLVNHYSGNARQDAAEIARECILGSPGRPRSGESGSWSGSIEDRDAIAEILFDMNIVYFDDMAGRWKIKNP